jgi:hypothetical protein
MSVAHPFVCRRSAVTVTSSTSGARLKILSRGKTAEKWPSPGTRKRARRPPPDRGRCTGGEAKQLLSPGSSTRFIDTFVYHSVYISPVLRSQPCFPSTPPIVFGATVPGPPHQLQLMMRYMRGQRPRRLQTTTPLFGYTCFAVVLLRIFVEFDFWGNASGGAARQAPRQLHWIKILTRRGVALRRQE